MGKHYVVIALVVVIVWAVALGFQPGGADVIQVGVAANKARAHQLAIACRLYATDHQGRFPMKLEELTPVYLDDLSSLHWRSFSTDGQPASLTNWSYFGGGFTENNRPAVLIVSPQSTATKRGQLRIVVQGDAAATPSIVEENRYRELLAQTAVLRRSLRAASTH